MYMIFCKRKTTVLQGGWPLFYIEWGWCWWNILILKTLWPLECSFWHYWHSFLRLSDSVFGIEKPPQNFGRVRGGISIIHLPIEVNPLWAVVFPLLCFQYSISDSKIQGILLILNKMDSAERKRFWYRQQRIDGEVARKNPQDCCNP